MTVAAHLLWLFPYALACAYIACSRPRSRAYCWPQAIAASALAAALVACLSDALAQEVSANWSTPAPSPWSDWLAHPRALAGSLAVAIACLAAVALVSFLARAALRAARRPRPAPGSALPSA